MKRILHATDYSENAIPALIYAFYLSKKLNASLFVIHVFDSLPLGLDGVKDNKHLEILTEFCKKHYVLQLRKTSLLNHKVNKLDQQ